MLSEAILEATRSESDSVKVYMKLESVSLTQNFFCLTVCCLTFNICHYGIFS